MSSEATRCLCAAALGLAASVVVRAAAAQEVQGASAEEEKRAVALLVLPEEKKSAESLVVAAGSGLVDLGVSLFLLEVKAASEPSWTFAERARDLAVSAGAFAAVWIDRSGGGAVYAIAADGVPEGVIERRVGEDDPDAQVEAMAVIIRTAVEQILDAETPPTPPTTPTTTPPQPEEEVVAPIAQAALPAPEPRAPEGGALERARRDSVGLTQEIEYAMHYASRGFGAIHGVNLRIGVSLQRRMAVYAGYTIFSSADVRTELAVVEFTRHPFHLGAKIRLGEGVIRGFAEVNVLVDYLVPRVVSMHADLVAKNPEGSIQASALVAAGLGFRVHTVATLIVMGGAEIPFNQTRHVLGSGDWEVVAGDPWPVQPWVLAGLVLDLL